MENNNGQQVNVRAMLFAVSELPAARKVIQFFSHKANKGCYVCFYEATREGEIGRGFRKLTGKMSYLTETLGEPRSKDQTRLQGQQYLQALDKSKAQATQVANANGVKYSELLRLPYYDPIRMSPVDHMHGFFLNMIKHESQLQLENIETSGMTARNVEIFADRIKRLQVPYDIGRLPVNIADPKLSLSGWRAIVAEFRVLQLMSTRRLTTAALRRLSESGNQKAQTRRKLFLA